MMTSGLSLDFHLILENTFHTVGGYHLWGGGTTHSPITQVAPISVLEASTVSTVYTASIEGPVTPYIHAVNAVHAVEAFNTDIGTAWVWGLWVVPPPTGGTPPTL